MTVPEKPRMARKLVELGVDILEVGFPIASQGDYDAVTAVSKEFPVGAGRALAVLLHAGCGTGGGGAVVNVRQPRIHLVIATSEIHLKLQAEEDAAAGAGRGGRRNRTGYKRDTRTTSNSSAEDAARTEPEFPREGVEGCGGRRCSTVL